MEYLEAKQMLKEMIKQESAIQRLERRKLRRNHRELAKEIGCSALSISQSRLVSRRAKITALLNMYNILRGKDYMHHVPKYYEYYYDLRYKELEEKICIDEFCFA